MSKSEIIFATILLAPGALAQKHEIGLTLGNLFGASRTSPAGQPQPG
jgi:hypothetical protein